MNTVQEVVILGSTGSVGQKAFDLVLSRPNEYRIQGLITHKNVDLLLSQVLKAQPEYVVVLDPEAGLRLQEELDKTNSYTEVLIGQTAMENVCESGTIDIAIAALAGITSIKAIANLLSESAVVLIANKEPLVIAGKLLMSMRADGETIIPVDSEHSAILQCLPDSYFVGRSINNLHKLILTCSGGPFRTTNPEDMKSVSVNQALNHPTWKMGRKITIDSATLMNKGFELIEAAVLFNTPLNKIDVVIHPESIVHGMVEYTDGSVIAAFSEPSMIQPITYALNRSNLYQPFTQPSNITNLLVNLSKLTFEAPDYKKFPCLELARLAGEEDELAPIILNAANDLAVEAFLNEQISLTSIPTIVNTALSTNYTNSFNPLDIEDIISIDAEIRRVCKPIVQQVAWINRNRV